MDYRKVTLLNFLGRIIAVSILILTGTAMAVELPSGTVIVTNMVGRTVSLIDAAPGVKRAEFQTQYDPNEVALSSDGRLVAVSNYSGENAPGNIIQIADLASGEVVRELEIEGYRQLHGVAFSPAVGKD